ncbi:Acyl-CoA N-acyltransferase with RING/FYVE/PHD-type zinc finger domain [Prunus dulcis]|uniref:Acyl-CoA N-acyltransferase with RING/FYVE/PHD-type zinc finger domain n=1 Tax=Prunus dulcis TaxID=3755 RepID=A0A4Y1RQA1_PRUDU|nr:Acyl-CoA N-acyltransferase with RING/FYVE/PHD-type zinc finger domain [Prunus dulcis]
MILFDLNQSNKDKTVIEFSGKDLSFQWSCCTWMEEEAVCLGQLTDGGVETDDFPRTELKRDHQCVVDDTEPDSFPNKKQAKEHSNEDIRSEVSNPVVSPKENASTFQDITSQPAEVENSNQVECGEVTSPCLGNSSSGETLSDGQRAENDNSTNGDVLTSRVVVEIPKLASSSGIRKITFKFSKKKGIMTTVSNGLGSGFPHGGSYEEPGTDFQAMASTSREFPASSYSRKELEASNKVSSNYPTNVKKLLSTGILDGARVKYVSTTSEIALHGIISNGGYLCACSSCNFTKVLSAYEFEQHAGVKTRHPNNHIYLENGRPVYSIIQELKTAPLDSLDEVIRGVAGSSVNEECFCVWKATLHRSDGMAEVDKRPCVKLPKLPNSIPKLPHSLPKLPHSLPRPTHSLPRDNDLHRLLFMPNGLPDGAKLAYYVKGQRLLGGYKQGNGIVCNCCDREISPSQFEAHAGMAARRQPYRHIYISNGLTLHDIAMSLANGQNLTIGGSDGNDDMCAVCGHDTGNMIFCDGCPRAYHSACLDLPWVPEGDWHCPNCRDKFEPGRKAAAGESSNFGKPIVIRLTRVFKAPEFEIGGCVVCRSHDFSAALFDDRTVIICDQCEKEFHVGCLRNSGLCDLKVRSESCNGTPKDKWFCCDECNKIHAALQNLVYNGAERIPAPLSDTIIRKHADRGIFIDGVTDDVQWRVFSGKSRYQNIYPFFQGLLQFFGRNISGQEFGGMYCVVLIVRSVVVSAGLLRVFGQEVAELPIVATSREHQGKGYFQALFSCIERLLISLKVEKLVLPAAEEAESIWTNKLGFRKMRDEQLPNPIL